MSLRRMKVLYCVVVIALGLILASQAGDIGQIAAVLLLASALPGWKLAMRTAAISALRNTRAQFTLPEDAHHNPSIDPVSEDRTVTHQSTR